MEAWKCKAFGVHKTLVTQKRLKSKMRRTTRIRRDAALEELHLQDRADRRERGRQEERAHRRERGRAQEFVQRRLRLHEEIAAHRQVCYIHLHE